MAAFRAWDIQGDGAARLHVGARRVEVGVVGHDFTRLDGGPEQDALGGAALVRGDDVLESGDLPDGGLEAIERACAGVRFVPLHHSCPLLG